MNGILEATVDLMTARGADRAQIRCAIGPCLRAPAFEVEDDLIAEVCMHHPAAEAFFTPGPAPKKSIFDHVAFVRWRLESAGIAPPHIEDVGGCTLTQPAEYFSYRAARSAGSNLYGRNLSAIARVTA